MIHSIDFTGDIQAWSRWALCYCTKDSHLLNWELLALLKKKGKPSTSHSFRKSVENKR